MWQVISCNYHICQIWTEPIRNCRCCRTEKNMPYFTFHSEVMAEWLYAYGSKSNVTTPCTPLYVTDDRCEYASELRTVVAVEGTPHILAVGIARERGNSRDGWLALDILWRLHFSRVRPAPARNTWYQLGPVENENIASHIHDKYYLYYA